MKICSVNATSVLIRPFVVEIDESIYANPEWLRDFSAVQSPVRDLEDVIKFIINNLKDVKLPFIESIGFIQIKGEPINPDIRYAEGLSVLRRRADADTDIQIDNIRNI